MKRVLAALTMAGTLGLAQGCITHDCTLVGWTEGLTVDVTSEEPLTPGVYHYLIEIPGQTFETDLTIVEPANTERGSIASKHLERGDWQVNVSLGGSSDFGVSGEVMIGRTGSGSGGPVSLTLTILQDEVEIGKLELDSIRYSQHEPNGPGCGVATTATDSIAITPAQ